MRKCLFVIFFFNFILLSADLFGAEKDDFHFILGFKIPAHAILKKDSPHIPIPEDSVDSGIGIGFYAEFIPFRYITIESRVKSIIFYSKREPSGIMGSGHYRDRTINQTPLCTRSLLKLIPIFFLPLYIFDYFNQQSESMK